MQTSLAPSVLKNSSHQLKHSRCSGCYIGENRSFSTKGPFWCWWKTGCWSGGSIAAMRRRPLREAEQSDPEEPRGRPLRPLRPRHTGVSIADLGRDGHPRSEIIDPQSGQLPGPGEGLEAAVVGPLDVVGEATGGQLFRGQVIAQAVAAGAFAVAAGVGAIAVLHILRLSTFHRALVSSWPSSDTSAPLHLGFSIRPPQSTSV